MNFLENRTSRYVLQKVICWWQQHKTPLFVSRLCCTEKVIGMGSSVRFESAFPDNDGFMRGDRTRLTNASIEKIMKFWSCNRLFDVLEWWRIGGRLLFQYTKFFRCTITARYVACLYLVGTTPLYPSVASFTSTRIVQSFAVHRFDQMHRNAGTVCLSALDH